MDSAYWDDIPTQEDLDEWADRERKRRQAWLSGPTEEDKREWLRVQQARAAHSAPFSPGPTAEEADEWAEREHRRRQAWAAGPTEEEKAERLRAYRGRSYAYERGPGFGAWDPPQVERSMERQRREADLATWGALRFLTNAPWWTWARLVDLGREAEDEFFRPVARRRVPYYD